MNSSTLYNFTLKSQGKQDVSPRMKGIALTNLLHNCIREYGKYDGCDYSVCLDDIDIPDMKLLLSYVMESIEDYESVIKCNDALKDAFSEHSSQIQRLIDAECAEVYRDDMEEMGMVCRSHPDNGESYWVRR